MKEAKGTVMYDSMSVYLCVRERERETEAGGEREIEKESVCEKNSYSCVL